MRGQKSFANSISIPLFICLTHSFPFCFHLIESIKIPKMTTTQNVQPIRMALRRTGVRIIACKLQS